MNEPETDRGGAEADCTATRVMRILDGQGLPDERRHVGSVCGPEAKLKVEEGSGRERKGLEGDHTANRRRMVSTSRRRRSKAFYKVRVTFRGQGAAVCTKHKTILR